MNDTLENKITEALCEFLGSGNTEFVRQHIGAKIAEICRNYPPTGELKVNRSIDMWSDMNFKEKVLWFVCNKMFKIIGKSYRELYQDYTLSKSRISDDSLQFKLPCWIESNRILSRC